MLVQQNHQNGRRPAHAARRAGLPHHLGETVVHGLPPTEMLYILAYELHGHIIENVSMTKYLGVTISSTTSKANKTLGFLRRNLKIGNKKTKKTAYKALVRPLLEYAATVWDPYTASEIQIIEKVQRIAARWVSNRHRQTSCVNTMLDALNWPTLQERHRRTRLEMFYKFHYGLVSINSSYLPKP